MLEFTQDYTLSIKARLEDPMISSEDCKRILDGISKIANKDNSTIQDVENYLKENLRKIYINSEVKDKDKEVRDKENDKDKEVRDKDKEVKDKDKEVKGKENNLEEVKLNSNKLNSRSNKEKLPDNRFDECIKDMNNFQLLLNSLEKTKFGKALINELESKLNVKFNDIIEFNKFLNSIIKSPITLKFVEYEDMSKTLERFRDFSNTLITKFIDSLDLESMVSVDFVKKEMRTNFIQMLKEKPSIILNLINEFDTDKFTFRFDGSTYKASNVERFVAKKKIKNTQKEAVVTIKDDKLEMKLSEIELNENKDEQNIFKQNENKLKNA